MSSFNNEAAKKEVQAAEGFTVSAFFASFKKYIWLSVTAAVLLAALSFAFFRLTFKPLYTSDVKFTITPLVSSDASNGASVYTFNYNATFATQMSETFPYIINSGIMNDMISFDLDREYQATISATAVKDTNIFEIAVTSPSARDAYDVIRSIMTNYPKIAEYVVGDTRMNVIEGSEPMMAEEPSNSGEIYPKVAIFAIVGVLVGAVAAYFDMRLKKTVSTKQDIERYFSAKCICEMPAVAQKRGTSQGAFLRFGSSLNGFSESVRVLRQRVQLELHNNGGQIIGVTSTAAAEGKTTVAYNLARSLSNGGKKVLLIDLDLRNRTIQNSINRKKEVPDTGITDVLTGHVELDDAIKSSSDTFDILFAGERNIKFRKEPFVSLFEHLKTVYDYIVVDMPACSVNAEAIRIADLCDGLLFVVLADKLSPEKIMTSVKDIAFSDAKLMGFVLNGASLGSSEQGAYKTSNRYGRHKYGYGYGYGYKSSKYDD